MGPELLENFRRILQSMVKDNWDLIIALAPQPCTPAIFFAALDEWKREQIMEPLRIFTRSTVTNFRGFQLPIKVGGCTHHGDSLSLLHI